MNISKNTEIINLPNGLTTEHIQQCIADKNLHTTSKYSYFGIRVQRGTMMLHTKAGDYEVTFRCENGWLTSLEFEKERKTNMTKKQFESIVDKCVRDNGIYDTKKYRYVLEDYDTLKRCPVDLLDTTEILNYEWQTIKKPGN